MNMHSCCRARRGLPLLAVLFVLTLLVGCGDKEPEQRAAFTAFLRESVIDAPRAKLDPLSDKQKKAFGDYAAHYTLLTDFRKVAADTTTENARSLTGLAVYESLEAVAGAERALRKASEEATVLHKKILALKAKTDTARKKLRQPDDLARVYDLAYEKAVSLPATAMAATFAAANEALTASLELIAFVSGHSRDMEFDGSGVNLKNPGLMDDLTAKMTVVREKGEALQKAYERMTGALR